MDLVHAHRIGDLVKLMESVNRLNMKVSNKWNRETWNPKKWNQ